MRLVPEIYTDKLSETISFYERLLNFKAVKLDDGFYRLIHQEEKETQLLLCKANSPFVHPIFQASFEGRGLIFQISTSKIMYYYKLACNLMRDSIALDIVTEPFNGTHFTLVDPNKILIDIESI